MSFINAILNYGPGQENLEFRLHLRYEFLMLGIQPVIDKLRKFENETLDRHLDFFEMVRAEDEKELARKFNEEHVDTKSASSMFDLIRRKLSHSPAYPHLLSLLEHMLLLPSLGSNSTHWLLFDRVVQQIVLQTEDGPEGDKTAKTPSQDGSVNDPDVAVIDINVNEIVKLLVKEQDFEAARSKADELERDNAEILSKLIKKEHEVDTVVQEKEDLETNLARMRERLEKESANHSQTVQRALNAEMKVEELQHRYTQEQHERLRLERLVTEGSIPDDQKISGLTGHVSPAVTPKAAPPPPPPLIMMNTPPPPPPPAPKVSSSVIPPPGKFTIFSNQNLIQIVHEPLFDIPHSSDDATNRKEKHPAAEQPIEEFQLVKVTRGQSTGYHLERIRW